MKQKLIFLVDIDGTFVNAGKQLENKLNWYSRHQQKSYDISKEVLAEFNKVEFYLDGNLEVIQETIDFINQEVTSKNLPAKIVFLSKSMSEEIAQAKIQFIKSKLNKFLNNIEFSFTDIVFGDPELKAIFQRELDEFPKEELKTIESPVKFICLDDNPERIFNYLSFKFKDNYFSNIEIVPISHPYNQEIIEKYKNDYYSVVEVE